MATCLSLMMSFLFAILMGFLCPSDAHRHIFYVGGKDGWVTKPSESYNQWAEKHHFFVHDELVFEYEEGQDSVLVVNEKDYYKCNKDNPIKVLKVKKNGESTFKFHRPGSFYFISGHYHNCEDGQKLIVLVRPKPDHHHHHRPTPSPETPSVSVPPVQPPSQSPSPAADTPFPADAPPPSDSSSQSPVADTPFPSNAPLVGPPSDAPSQSPAAETPFPADAPLVGPPSDAPSQSPEADTPFPVDVPLVGPPSNSPSQSPAADTPFPADVLPPSNSPSPYPAADTPFPAAAPLNEPVSDSPSQSPKAQTILADHDALKDHPHSQSPLPSTRDKAPVPSEGNIALPPHAFSPHYAPAPAPSSASGFGGSFLVIVGLMSVAATMISTGPVV